MWFQLKMSTFGPKLGALCGVDGTIYWRLVDVAYLLKKRNAYSFAKRFPCVMGSDVLPSGIYPAFTMKAKLVETGHALDIIAAEDVELAQHFKHVLEEGYCRVDGPTSADSVKLSVVVDCCNCNESDPGALSVAYFIQWFKNDVATQREERMNRRSEVSQQAPEVKEETGLRPPVPPSFEVKQEPGTSNMPINPPEIEVKQEPGIDNLPSNPPAIEVKQEPGTDNSPSFAVKQEPQLSISNQNMFDTSDLEEEMWIEEDSDEDVVPSISRVEETTTTTSESGVAFQPKRGDFLMEVDALPINIWCIDIANNIKCYRHL